MITEKDFQNAIEKTWDNESAAAACFKLAQQMADEQNKKLIAHRDQTVGLWATDLPGMVNDPKKVMFEIKF